ncbi:MAG TPA: sulfatase-like hydrolase/transferase [Noviherbaspirillum sp.]|uniref:phosphoethanolamine transferase n=1 Tax=Noviherbaspirillum sp. TaxID=1926288 RepID=UPI002F930472
MLRFRSPVPFALMTAGMFLLAFNQRFWSTALASGAGGAVDVLHLASLGMLLLLAYAGALLLIPGSLPMKIVAALLLPVGAMAAYCADSFGVVIDAGMIRNLGETDRREVMGLLTPRLLVYIIGLGVVPVFLVARSQIAPIGLRRQLQHRLAFLAIAAAMAALALAAMPRLRAAVLDQEQLRRLAVPGAAVVAGADYLRVALLASARAGEPAPAGQAWRIAQPPHARPLLVFLVVGETARHKNFQLGGYARPTNPGLSRIDNLTYFTRAEACGTSTAVSVPCMLSHLGRNRFSLPAYDGAHNVLGALATAGVAVEWRSNNTAKFDPGRGVRKVALPDETRPDLCGDESCLDELLLVGLPQRLRAVSADSLLAFHQMGSHGPAYFLRYPASMQKFAPACRNKDLGACSAEELRNAYDNTIHYTDHLLSTMIAMLARDAAQTDSALIYVSDHGESLGENGLFLHSAPYASAPEEQKRIPFMLWMSEGYRSRFGIDSACLRHQRDKAIGHDHVFHTLLGMMAARSTFYTDGLDLLAPCRTRGG